MKAFSLEEYLKDPSRKVVTRDGRNVRIICTDRVGIFPIIGLISSDSIADFEEIVWYTKEGVCNTSTENRHDLFFAEKQEGWMNIYRARGYCYGGSVIYPTEVAAKASADPDPVATIKIEWEE